MIDDLGACGTLSKISEAFGDLRLTQALFSLSLVPLGTRIWPFHVYAMDNVPMTETLAYSGTTHMFQ